MKPTCRLAWDTALETGLRVSDVIRLRPEDINQESCRITVTEVKTHKLRSVEVSHALTTRLLANAKSGYCFPGRKKGFMARNTIGNQVRKAAARTPGLEGAIIGMHSARKMYAQEQMERTKDARAVQIDLGHTNIATTLLYIYGAPCAPLGASTRP